jgi:uncharacterized protein (TIGR04255 family)
MIAGYKHPPITEAVLELRFKSAASMEMIEKAVRRAAPRYFYTDPDNAVQLNINPEKQAPEILAQWQGTKLSTLDRADIVIFRTSAYVCSRLSPYPGWDAFRKHAQEGWEDWKKVAGPTEVVRIGLRYINRIDVPAQVVKVEDYLTIVPLMPELGFGPITSYAMQIIRPLTVDDCYLILNSGPIAPPLLDHLSISLDIDIYRESDIPRREDELWALIDKMRFHKNRVFESLITDKARELFNRDEQDRAD